MQIVNIIMIFQRKLFKSLEAHLSKEEITLLSGARQVGKTTLLKELKSKLDEDGKKTVFLNLEILEYLALLDRDPENIWQFAEKNSKEIQYIFLDEIQYLKNPSNFLKHLYDEYHGKLKLIVSGSSAFYIDQKFTDSLAGRKRLFVLRSLNFEEFLLFQKREDLSLKIAKNKKSTLPEKKEILEFFEEYLIYGGYPKVVLSSRGEKEMILMEIINSYLKKDVDEYGVRDAAGFIDFLRLLAGQSGNLLNQNEVSATLKIPLLKVGEYLKLLEKTFYLQRVRPFHGNLRKELTKMPKCYFLDNGVRNYLLKDFRRLTERPDKGSLIEQSVFIELVNKYPDDRSINFWRTQDQNEVDFVIDGKIAYEVKYDLSNFSLAKYRAWTEGYPGIPLRGVGVLGVEGKGKMYPWEA